MRISDWSSDVCSSDLRLLAEGKELLAYFEGVARDHGVLPLIRFGDEVVRLVYVDGKWNLTTAAGYRDRFDLVISATGVLHHPNVPEFEGLDSFKGASFHSSRWEDRKSTRMNSRP